MESSKNRHSDALVAAVSARLAPFAAPGTRFVVALSGGLDSVVLLNVLADLRAQFDLHLAALHVHHGLSPNADAWEAHCRWVCTRLEVPIKVERVAVDRSSCDGLEAAARRARHAAFERTVGDWIVLAHHLDDQAETLLFNLLRGTGLRGARGMVETNGRLLRPLLGSTRAAIESYARGRGLEWICDESNDDTAYARNFLRHETLGGLARRFPGSMANLAAAARRFAEAQTLLDDLALMDLSGAPDFPVDIETWSALPEPRARNALRYLLHRRHVGIPSERRLCEFVRQLRAAGPDRHPSVIFGTWRLVRRARQIHLEPLQSA